MPPAQPAAYHSLQGPSGAELSSRWRRWDILKIIILAVIPAALLLTAIFPLRSQTPSRDELRDALRTLDKQAYAQSGCERVAETVARCDETRTCEKQTYFTLRNLARNCHSISTKELERCLMTYPGGKCIFERLEEYCKDDIEVILTCHRTKMTELLSKVLLPSLKGPGAGESDNDTAAAANAAKREADEWRAIADAAISILTRAEGEPSSIISWALTNNNDDDTDDNEESLSNIIGVRHEALEKMIKKTTHDNNINDKTTTNALDDKSVADDKSSSAAATTTADLTDITPALPKL